ncbi:MAG: PA14 domain-containing protein, partial [Thermoplasmatota archaeon]
MSVKDRSILVPIMIVLLMAFPSLLVLPDAYGGRYPLRSAELLGKWDLGEGEGQYTYDGSGNGNHGVLGGSIEKDTSDPSWGTGVHDAALAFDGVDDLVNCGNRSSLQMGKGSFSIETWVHVRQNMTDNLGGILSKYDPTSDRGFFLDVLSGQRYGGTGDSRGQLIFGMNQGYRNSSWNTVSGQYDTSTCLNDIVVYDKGLFAATSQGDIIEWTASGWVKRAPPYTSGMINCMAVYNGKIFGAVAATGELVRLDGSSLTRVAQSFNSELIISMAVHNGMLYAGTSPSGLLLEWNGVGAWAQAASQYSLETNINGLCSYNGHLYGTSSPGGYLLQWNNRDSWVQKAELGSGLNTLVVYRGKLYSAYTSLFEWNGVNSWVPRTSAIPSGTFSTMTVFSGRLLGATSGGILYEWNGIDAWVLRAPASGSEYPICAMCAFSGRLFAATGGHGSLLEWNSGFSVTSDTGIAPGWNQIVAVKNASEGTLSLYINGELESVSGHFDPLAYDLNCSFPLVIGQGAQDNYRGLIDRVRIFGKPLSSEEVSFEYDFFSMEWKAPLPPTSPSIRSGDLFVNLSWGPPNAFGTHELLGYVIYRGTTQDDLSFLNVTSTGVRWFNDTNVAYGNTYYYLVSAYSEAGESSSEDILSTTPKGCPSPPMNLTVHSGDRFVNISWKPPLKTKGSNLTAYRIERGLDLHSFGDLIQVGAEKRYYNDTVVDNRQTYYYRVYAKNEVGESSPSTTVSAVPKKLSPPVTSLELTPSDRGAYLTWNKCSDPYFQRFNIYRGIRDLISGGLIGRYYSEPDLTNLSFQTQDLAIDFDWGTDPPLPRMGDNNFSVKWDGYLKASTTGSYTIILRVDGGVRLWVDNILLIDAWEDRWYESLSASVYLISGEHQVKIDYFNWEGRASMRLSWAPPDQDPFVIPTSGLYGYYITYELLASTGETSYQDQGLEMGRYYYYFVKAVNDAGESLMGSIIELYAIGTPGEPRGFLLSVGDSYINLSWEPPIELGGSNIIEYRIFRANGTDYLKFYTNVSGDRLFFNDTDVDNGLDYFYYLTAVNEAGESGPSASLKGIPVGRPTPPRNPKAELYEGGVKITWSSPKFTGGVDLSGYNIYRSVNGGNRTFIYWVNDFLI